jgi:phosphoribosyl-AMP cyclohydrolase / phosphoribosyl-ATP pyrophosphohydrolase
VLPCRAWGGRALSALAVRGAGVMMDLSALRFNEQELIPTIVQDVVTGQVLMLAYMNREALQKTLATGIAHYWSRSRAKLWQKGETSGHIQYVREIRYDCDADTLLMRVEQVGVACHTGQRSCFFRPLFESPQHASPQGSEALLSQLYEVILERKQRAPQESYVASLMARGQDQVLKKIVEEAAEVVMASKDGQPQAIIYEMADLWFHSIVALGWHSISPQEVLEELHRRFGTSGLRSAHLLPSTATPEQSA